MSDIYAVIKTGGKQYTVKAGDKVIVEKLECDLNSIIEFKDVLLVEANGETKIGTPLVAGAVVKAKVIAQSKGAKVIIFKKRRRKGYRNKNGHRQPRTEVIIESIAG